jgi:basic membrane protein A and related proteins
MTILVGSQKAITRLGIAAAIAAVLIVAAVGHPIQPYYSFAQPATPLKVVFVTDAKFNDGGWGAVGFNATQALKGKYAAALTSADGIAIPDIESTLTGYADGGANLIIAQGFQWGDPVLKVAPTYPDIKFVVMTGLVQAPNVESIFPMQQQGSFILGALAAMMSKTGTIGFVGGETYPNIINIAEGYKQGARLINPNIKVLSDYLHDFNNPAKGREAALAQIDAGADFLLHVADTSGHGVIEAAAEKGVYAFGAVADQNKLAPNTVLTSFVIDMDKAYDQAYKSVVGGSFAGKLTKPGLETGKGGPGDGIVYLAPFHSLDNKVPANVKAKIAQLTQDVISGKILVPERTTPTA